MNKLNEDFVTSMIELVELVKYEHISFSHFMKNFDDLLSSLATEKLIHKLPWSAILNNLENRLNLNSQPSLLILRKNYVYGKRKINDNDFEKSIIDSIFSVVNEYDHKGLNNVAINHIQSHGNYKQESTTSNENYFSNDRKYQRTEIVNGLCKSLENLPRLPYMSSKLNKCEEIQNTFISEVAVTASNDDTNNNAALQINKIYNDKNVQKLSSWGQRKLLLTEIYFLSCYAVPGDTVLYVGAAPGNHIPYLATTLFPFLHFDLYDPALFDFECDTIPNVTIYNDFFRNDNIEKYTSCDGTKINKSKLLFISDIRRLQHDESLVKEDLDLQSIWCRLLQPKAAMLKFRLPYGSGTTVYLKGQLLLQPYIGPRSTEARLIVTPEIFIDDTKNNHIKCADDVDATNCDELGLKSNEECNTDNHRYVYTEIEYDNLLYEEQFCYFNQFIRTQSPHYKHNICYGFTESSYYVNSTHTIPISGVTQRATTTCKKSNTYGHIYHENNYNESAENSLETYSHCISSPFPLLVTHPLGSTNNDNNDNNDNNIIYGMNPKQANINDSPNNISANASNNKVLKDLLTIVELFSHNMHSSVLSKPSLSQSNRSNKKYQIITTTDEITMKLHTNMINEELKESNKAKSETDTTNYFLTCTGLREYFWDSLIEIDILNNYVAYILKYKDNFIKFLPSSSSIKDKLDNTLADKLNILNSPKQLQIHKTEINHLTQQTELKVKVNCINKDIIHQDQSEIHSENAPKVSSCATTTTDENNYNVKDLFIGSLIININNALGWQDAWLEYAITTPVNSNTNHTADVNDIHHSSFNKSIDSNNINTNAVFDKNDAKCLNVKFQNETNILVSQIINECNIPLLKKTRRQSVSFASDSKQATQSQSHCLDF